MMGVIWKDWHDIGVLVVMGEFTWMDGIGGLGACIRPVTLTLALSHQGRGDFPAPVCPEHTPLASLAPLSPSERGVLARCLYG